MIELDKIIAILKYCGPQTYNDLLFQGFQGDESDLEQLVSKGILFIYFIFYKNGVQYIKVPKNRRS